LSDVFPEHDAQSAIETSAIEHNETMRFK